MKETRFENVTSELLPPALQPFYNELATPLGITLAGANAIMAKYIPILHSLGWRFRDLSDLWGEWNLLCRPPEEKKTYHFQRLDAIPNDPWRCYIAHDNL